MDWLVAAVDMMLSQQEAIRADNQRALEQLEEVKAKLQQLGAQFDEQVLRDLRTGMRHLVDGLNSDLEDVRADELRMARGDFNRLLSLDPSGTTSGLSGEVSNSHLIALGHWGNTHYFNLRGDMRNALLQAYECTHKFPLLGLAIFSSELFSRNYLDEIIEASAKFEALKKQRDDGEWNNFLKGLGYYTKQTLRWLGAGTAALFAFAIHPGFGFATLAAMGETSIEVPKYDDVKSLEKAIASVSEQLEQIAKDLNTECEDRIAALRKVTLDDLRKISLGNHPTGSGRTETRRKKKSAAKALSAADQGHTTSTTGGQGLTALEWFEAAHRSRDVDEQLHFYSNAIDLNPSYAEAYSNRAYIRYRKGDFDGAIADFDEALRLDPQDATAAAYRKLAIRDKTNQANDQ